MAQHLLRWLMRLYPAWWRARYAVEFAALLADIRPSWHDALDLLRGALDAHLHPELGSPGRWPMTTRLYRLAGGGALLSALLLVLALLNSARLVEGASEFLLLISPIALLPAVVVLDRLLRPHAARLSRVARWAGLVGLGAFWLLALLGTLADALSLSFLDALTPLAWLFQLLIALSGVWLLLVGYLAWRTAVLPPLLAGLLLAAGLAWLGMAVGIVAPRLAQALPAVWSLNLFVWMILHVVSTAWLGGWLLAQSGDAPPLPA